MVDFIITDFESVRGGGNIVDTVPSIEDFIVDNCTISSSSSGEFVLTPGASDVASVSLTVSSASVTVGGTVTLTATVLDDEDDPLEDVLVSFYRSGTVIGSDTTDSSGIASYTATMSSPGTFSMTAVAGGVTSTAQIVTVNKITSTISLSSSSASATCGTSVTLSGTLSVGSGELVKLYKEAVLVYQLATGTGGAFSYSTSSLPVGSHSFTAVYEGDITHTDVTSSAVTVTITKITSTISLSAVSSTISVGDSPQLTGTLSVGSGESVKIYLGDVLVDTVTTGTNGAFSFTGSATSSAGSLTFKAVYDGDSTHSSVTSSNVVITVSGGTPVVTSVSLSSDKSVLSAYDSESATLSATVLDGSSNPMEGETVTFYNGSTSIGTATTNSSGIATKSYSATGVGDVTFKATSSNIESSTVTVEDCWNTKLTEQTITCTSSNKYTSVGLNTIHNIKDDNFVLEFDSKGNGTLSVGHSSYWESSTNYRATLGTADGKHYYSARATSTSESYGGTYDSNTYYHYKLTREGSTIKFYVDGTLLGTKTASFFSSYTTWCIYSIIWGANTSQTIKNIKIKLL